MSENSTTTILKPFLDRISHPILSWVILFNIIFNYDKIIKLSLVLSGRATLKPEPIDLLLQYVPLTDLTNFSYCYFFFAIALGTTIGILWPVLDKLYQEHISKQAVLLEDAIMNQKKGSSNGRIIELQGLLTEQQVELSAVKQFICNRVELITLQSLKPDINDALQIQICKCDENVEVTRFGEIDINGKVILASHNEKVSGLVVAKISTRLCILLVKGSTIEQKFLTQFSSNTKYKLIEGSPKPYNSIEDDWIAYRNNNTLSIKNSI